ncbi:hypothetical protein DDA93_05180 [Arthrobacter sp. Bz4]|nr:hypothetical protein DDA93_05180 [Arthrobacter sp. Bz4]
MLIQSLQPGDKVFHYQKSYLRAVSRVATSWQPWSRPEENPKVYSAENDDGWLVTVDPIQTGLALHYSRAAELIRNGPGSPINAAGHPQQKFLSALSEEDGRSLLHELGMAASAAMMDGLYGRPDEWDGGETDEVSLGTVRQEQADLRRHLLNGRPIASCSVCGEERPAKLLVAGHIKPRNSCTEEERKNFRSVAMLVCSLGCDALFGWGYIYVDPEGYVRRGVPAETKDVEAAVDLLIGKHSGAHNEQTARNFAAHAELSGAT